MKSGRLEVCLPRGIGPVGGKSLVTSLVSTSKKRSLVSVFIPIKKLKLTQPLNQSINLDGLFSDTDSILSDCDSISSHSSDSFKNNLSTGLTKKLDNNNTDELANPSLVDSGVENTELHSSDSYSLSKFDNSSAFLKEFLLNPSPVDSGVEKTDLDIHHLSINVKTCLRWRRGPNKTRLCNKCAVKWNRWVRMKSKPSTPSHSPDPQLSPSSNPSSPVSIESTSILPSLLDFKYSSYLDGSFSFNMRDRDDNEEILSPDLGPIYHFKRASSDKSSVLSEHFDSDLSDFYLDSAKPVVTNQHCTKSKEYITNDNKTLTSKPNDIKKRQSNRKKLSSLEESRELFLKFRSIWRSNCEEFETNAVFSPQQLKFRSSHMIIEKGNFVENIIQIQYHKSGDAFSESMSVFSVHSDEDSSEKDDRNSKFYHGNAFSESSSIFSVHSDDDEDTTMDQSKILVDNALYIEDDGVDIADDELMDFYKTTFSPDSLIDIRTHKWIELFFRNN